MSCLRRLVACCLVLAPLALALAPAPAAAATWGSFSASRIAYAIGPLSADAHAELRDIIVDHGDTVAPGTPELTADYLASVDVFYTSMLSDGTGPTAGAPGTLSLPEQAALADFIAGGGTLVITVDSNGLDGPFEPVYGSWLEDYGVGDLAFVFGPGEGSPVVVHPITGGVNRYALDSIVSFTYPAEGQLLGTALGGLQTLMVVFEPASGFAEGGRMLVLGDHNMLTDNYIGDLDNTLLAENIVEWASGECGNTIVESGEQCDDGNTDDGDGCTATCMLEAGPGSSTGSADDTTGESPPPPDETGDPPSGTSSTTAPTDTDTVGEVPPDESGCSCRTQPTPQGMTPLLLLAIATLRRRRPLKSPARPTPPRAHEAAGPA